MTVFAASYSKLRIGCNYHNFYKNIAMLACISILAIGLYQAWSKGVNQTTGLSIITTLSHVAGVTAEIQASVSLEISYTELEQER